MKQKLTRTLVDKTTAPATGDVWIWDTELNGFGLRVQAGGRKTYVIRYRTKNAARTQRKMVISRCSDMPPEKARELARREFAKVAEGLDPAAERKPDTAAPKTSTKTVGLMFEAYVTHMRDKGRASVDEVGRALLIAKNNAADALGRDKPAAEVTPGAVVDYLSQFYAAGHRGAADKHRSYIASAYAWAIKSANDYTAKHRQDWGVTSNPAAVVARDHGATSARDRTLTAAELRTLWMAADPELPTGFSLETAGCIRLLIACGQRVQETLRIEGRELDLAQRVWTMPAHKTKGRKHAHKVPLPDIIIPTLTLLVSVHGDGPLFPARTGSKSALIDHRSIMQAIDRWQPGTEVAAFQTRDLRRTWKSRTHDAGIDRFTRDLIQQHAQGGDTGSKHYDRANYLPQMREAMGKWSAWLALNLAEPQVIQLKAA